MIKIITQQGKDVALTADLIEAIQNAYTSIDSAITLKFVGNSPTILEGLYEFFGNITDGWVRIAGETYFFQGGIPLPKYEIVEEIICENSGTDVVSGNQYYSKAVNRYCRFSATGTYNFVDLVRYNLALKSVNASTFATFNEQDVREPFSTNGDVEGKIDQFNVMTLNLNLAAPAQTWSGWFPLMDIPIEIRPATTLEHHGQMNIILDSTYMKIVPYKIASGVLSIYIDGSFGGSMNVFVRLKYSL